MQWYSEEFKDLLQKYTKYEKERETGMFHINVPDLKVLWTMDSEESASGVIDSSPLTVCQSLLY